MDINVSTAMGFENQSFMNDTAKTILHKSGVESEKAEEIANSAVFNFKNSATVQSLELMGLSSRVLLNNSLRETLNYLKKHANEKKKRYIFGELWENFLSAQENDEDYNGELIEFEIDETLTNIFAA